MCDKLSMDSFIPFPSMGKNQFMQKGSPIASHAD